VSATAESPSGAPAAAAAGTAGTALHVQLDYPLPTRVAVGTGTAIFVCGWCFHPEARVRSVTFLADGDSQPAAASGMARSDVFKALHPSLDPYATVGLDRDGDSPEDPGLRSFRSGFWGLVRLSPRPAGGTIELRLRATLDDGRQDEAELGRITTAGPSAEPITGPAPDPAAGPFVAICMATFDPPPGLFERQLDSIRAQTHRNWICVISDDCSSPDRYEAIERAVAGDPRFVLSRSPERLHFYRNFERALELAPRGADYVAMADQDDFWHPDKLEALIAQIGGAQLAYSDARIIDRGGDVISDSYWSIRRPNHENLLSLLVANSITGAASLFRRDLLDYALPFPPRQFSHFHDHWIGLTARVLGDVAFVERPLYDYVQHGGAVLGHAGANWMPPLRDRLGWLKKDPKARVRSWRLHYFVDCWRLIQFTTILDMRCGGRIGRRRRRTLGRFAQAERSPLALANLGRRAVRELVGESETLGAEVALFFAFVWRRLVEVGTWGLERPRRRLRIDARPPMTLLPTPGRRDPNNVAVGAVGAKIAPLEWAVQDHAPQRVNILIPTIDLEHFFGGYIAKLNLARRLAERGARVRIVTVDPVPTLPATWPQRIEAFSGLRGLFDRVEVEFGRESQAVEVSRSDSFIATTWWTAHIADAALRDLDGKRFLYLIQEYEPFTFPMGTYAALASESYRLPHSGLFSSELLRDYFRRHKIGVYADGPRTGDEASTSFENAITAIDPPHAAELARRETRRLLFYARPEPHAARNMFELGVLALSRAVKDGGFGPAWTFSGVGTVEAAQRLELGGGAVLQLIPRRDQGGYAELLRDHDVGLALMYTPHPSLVPIEMASAGMLTVTNSFENKTAAALEAISPNLIAAEPSIDGIAAGLRAAAAAVEDHERRARGSAVNWSRDWATTFDDSMMERIESLLGGR
jgi:glycosyltransferase involved in cell wall biosynthesis